jgi:hypothetical protein
MKEKRKARKYQHKNLALSKSCPYPHQNWSMMVVEKFLRRINPSDKNNKHETPQGMTKNHHENTTKGDP